MLLISGHATEALAQFEREPEEGSRLVGRALANHAMGLKTEADSALARLGETYADRRAYSVARVHAYRGELDQAFAWLDRAYLQRDINCVEVKRDVLLRNLIPDPRFAAYLRKMRLPE